MCLPPFTDIAQVVRVEAKDSEPIKETAAAKFYCAVMSIVNSIRARRQLKMRQRHPEQPGLRKEQKIQENKGYYPTLKQTCARIFSTFCVPLAFFQLIYLLRDSQD